MTPEQIRKARGDISRKDFSKLIMYSNRTIEAWELGRRSPSSRAIKAMSKFND
jgi:DNA-binding transcriptional regulator YiaG